ncbi:transposase, partial [Nostoc sp.]|uniref:transposase n=1 Tax=Nostoc sp. TaxID=1180 RepID=UPI002FF47AAD
AGATLHFLSSYSPDFSPIENCWSKVKEFIRSIAVIDWMRTPKSLLSNHFSKVFVSH